MNKEKRVRVDYPEDMEHATSLVKKYETLLWVMEAIGIDMNKMKEQTHDYEKDDEFKETFSRGMNVISEILMINVDLCEIWAKHKMISKSQLEKMNYELGELFGEYHKKEVA